MTILFGGPQSDTMCPSPAEELWSTLRVLQGVAPAAEVADAEDALFRHYLPLAESMADNQVHLAPQCAADARSLADIGLAHAVLWWKPGHAEGFERFARQIITSHLRHDRGPGRERTARDRRPASERRGAPAPPRSAAAVALNFMV